MDYRYRTVYTSALLLLHANQARLYSFRSFLAQCLGLPVRRTDEHHRPEHVRETYAGYLEEAPDDVPGE